MWQLDFSPKKLDYYTIVDDHLSCLIFFCRRFIRKCKQGCLQFVILKPILVVVTLILYAKGKYKDGNFSPKQSYLYLTIIYTFSYTMALYALVLFYVACKDLLQPFNPVPKFIIIKSVVFLTYWQVLFMHLSFNGLFFPCNIKLYLLLCVSYRILLLLSFIVLLKTPIISSTFANCIYPQQQKTICIVQNWL